MVGFELPKTNVGYWLVDNVGPPVLLIPMIIIREGNLFVRPAVKPRILAKAYQSWERLLLTS